MNKKVQLGREILSKIKVKFFNLKPSFSKSEKYFTLIINIIKK